MTNNRLQNLKDLRLANADVAFATAFATLVTGAFLVGFVKLLGGSDLWIGVLSAVPSMLGILQIPGAIWGRAKPSFKRFVLPGGLVWRLLYIPIAALPLLPIDNELRLLIVVICVSVAAASNLIVAPVYSEWISEMVPQNSRGWFFGRRNAIATGVGALIGVGGGLLLDAFRKAGNEPLGLTTVFGCGVLFAGISFVLFMRMRDLERPTVVTQNFKMALVAIRAPFADKEFRRVLFFLAAFFVGQTFAGNLYAAYAIESLKLSFTVIQLTGLANAAGIVLAASAWGFLADKYGNKPTLALAGLGIATNPIAWLLTIPGHDTRNIVILLTGHVIMGFFWSGVAIGQLNLLLATAKPEDRANYLGAGLALQSVVSGVAPLLGASLMAFLRPNMDPVTAYKCVFVGALILRASAVMFLGPVREEGSSKVRTTLRDLRRVRPGGVRTMRALAKSTGSVQRAEALESVANQRLTLAIDEVLRSLADPSPLVRRHAANALAKIGDPAAAEPLLRHIEQHPDLVEEETIEALGAIGTEKVVASLISFLTSPRSTVRRAAAHALGRNSSPESVAALTLSAGAVDDPDLQRVSLRSLRLLHAREAAPVISDALFNPHPSVRIAAAEAVAEMELKSALPFVRQSLAYYQDEASSEVAYALSAIGGVDQLPQIYEVARSSKTSLARRRCLLGIARLLGVETASYKLFLKTGMARDTAILDLLVPITKRSRKVRVALERYSSGDEPGALALLGQATNDPVVKELAEHPLADMFLVLAPYVAKSFSPTSKQSTMREVRLGP